MFICMLFQAFLTTGNNVQVNSNCDHPTPGQCLGILLFYKKISNAPLCRWKTSSNNPLVTTC